MRHNLTVTLAKYLTGLLFILSTFFSSAQAPLYTDVLISDVGDNNGIGQANTSRNLAVDAIGNIYCVFVGSQGVRVAKSINRGQSFLPSVQVSTVVATEPEINIEANGYIYVTWSVSQTIYLSYSTNDGLSFSNPTSVGTGGTPHLTSYGPHVYIVGQNGKNVYHNHANGVGTFAATLIGYNPPPNWAYSDIRADRNGDVYVVVDNPVVYLFRSTDNASTFVEVPLVPRPQKVYFSSYCLIAGSFGSYIFTGGGNLNDNPGGREGARIDVSTGITNVLNLQDNSNQQGRSLFADEFGNIVDGFYYNGIIGFRVSHDQGTTWNTPVNMLAAQTHNIFRNHQYQDVLVAYRKNDNQVYLAVYPNLLLGLTNTTPPLNDCAGKPITVTYNALGPFTGTNVFTAQLSDANGSFANAVNIGTVTSTTSGTIAAVIPPNTPGGTGYRIRVKSSTPELFGTDNGSNLTVNPNPGSNFTFATQQCEGTAVAFTNTTPANPGAATMEWTFGALGTSAQTNPSFSFPPGGPYDVKLVSTTAQGCKDSITKQVTVGAKPLPQFTMNAAIQCIASNNFVFTNTTPNPATFTYEWKFGDGATATGLNASHSYSAVGPYTVTLIATAANGCRDSVKHNVTVNTSTNPSFTVNAATQCLGMNSFLFTNTTPPGSTYEWKFGDGATAAVANPSHVYAAANVYTVKLIATAAGGCKDSTTQPVTVNPNPAAAFTVNTPLAQCFTNHNYSFTNTSTAGATIQYHFGDGAISSLPNPSHSYAAESEYIVRLVATNTFGCKDSIPQTVTVKPSPAPGFTVNAATQCLVNNAFQFTNTSTAPSGTMTYSWKFGDGGTSALRDPVHSYAATGAYTVKLYVWVNGDCLDSAQATVNINPTPDAGFTANSVNAQCLNGNSYSFTNSSVIASGTLSYLWKFGDGVTATAQNATHVFTVAGTYTVKLYATAVTGCIDSAEHTVTVHPKPNVSFVNDNPEQCLPTNHFTFTNTTTIGSGNMSQLWYYGDGATSVGVNGDHTYATFGNYTVKLVVTSDKGCKDSTDQPIGFLPKPVPVFTINDAGQCLTGNAFTFTDGSSITAGTFTRE